MSAGIPVKLLNEAQGHIVSLELNSGETYRAEDNMNVQLNDITLTSRDGKVTHLDHVFIRGSNIRFFVVPDMLRNAPMFDPNHTKPPPPIRGPKRR
ncbi:Small nuclear ribonucleoprotein Sm D3 [Wickerhamomyces ciferrii]|uniref:Small nuclear ribonucleoprotein Sm D3 n=1 Tax=Wickerhamomyces ciferrii (strain ATCC 14091 / BCRC 22168 / CBS 111 / JCM 3599 / NBRC 0793 / NRRL Y-1031 F-60-10) TaxID=1206466 RepID=K0KF07_WICCF|nr:Small nuclear ribonucleoprotein Sm D3 [Wickerhamomyces ciferrii]CCH41546.1 Small nuclear ribonucleoprotein Sm D3 [Wickerhamomyces ciferrii]